MKQFIRYLYEYEQGKRVRNVGFVRVEQTEEETVVHIHGKGLRIQGTRQLTVYLFYEEDDTCMGIRQGEIENVNPAVNYRLRYTRQDTGEPENYPRIDGVILESEGQRRYAAVWDDMPADINQMVIWEKKTEVPTIEQNKTERGKETENAADMREDEGAQETEVLEDGIGEETVSEQSREAQFRGARAERAGRPDGDRDRKTRKIQRKDLAQLPRCEWKLSNNSFLLHGYYNYRHLLLIEEGEAWKLGVPGIYHEKEANAAGAFGFGEFIPAEELEGLAVPEEWNVPETFGYWCRPVRH